MTDAREAAIDRVVLDGGPSAAAAAVDASGTTGDASRRRLAAAVYALTGKDRALAAALDAGAFARSDTDIPGALVLETARWEDLLPAAALLAWRGDADGSLRHWQAAVERAERDERYGNALATLERYARHALLFGNAALASDVLERARDRAAQQQSPRWRARIAAIRARLAAYAGDLDEAASILEREVALPLDADNRALFAPTGVEVAIAAGDQGAIEAWAGRETVEVAMRSRNVESVASAVVAVLLAMPNRATPSPELLAATRRALLAAESAASETELFATAARCTGVAETRYAVAALTAVRGADRPFLAAHRQLAHAHAEFRFGDRTAAVDWGGDAARAFDALGLRRWTNEAMSLLVHRQAQAPNPVRRRPNALSLTERERQVAHLIRRGASNREIARTLQISEHTVERHVSSILSRLGFRSRWQIVDHTRLDGA